jgi:hypothetical protein
MLHPAINLKKNPGAISLAAGANSILRITNALYPSEYDSRNQLPNRRASVETSSTTTTSTGLGPESREYWLEHGTNWRALIELHLAIVNRLAAASSWRSS